MSRAARIILLVVAGAACVLVPALIVAGVGGPVRVAATLALMCLTPGTALLACLPAARGALELGLVVATSLALYALGSELLLAFGAWSPKLAASVVAVGCLPALAIRVYKEVRTRPPAMSSNER
jgi:hypothetical protein